MKEKKKKVSESSSIPIGGYSLIEKSLFFGFIGISILIILSIFIDTPFLWGIHFLRFLPPVFVIISIILLCIVFVPSLTKYFDKTINITCDYFKDVPKVLKYIFGTIFSVLFLYSLKIRVPLLGDSYLLLSNMYQGGDYGFSIKEFLLRYLFEFLVSTFKYLGPKSTASIYSTVSIISGLFFIFVIYKIALLLSNEKRERLVIFVLSFFSGSSLLVFGYVENYPIIYLLYSIFIYFALRFVKKREYFYTSILFYIILLFTHYASIMLTPIILYLVFLRFGRKKFLFLIIFSFFFVSVIYLILYFSESKSLLLKVQKDILNNLMVSASKKESTLWAYGFISWYHLIDCLNLIVVINPLFIFLAGLYIFDLKKHILRTSEIKLSLIGALSVLFVLFMINYPYGASKDWDIIATYSLPINLFAALVLIKLLKKSSRRNYLFFITFAIMTIHTMSYVFVYAMEGSAIERTKSLYDKRIMSEFGGTSTYLNIANYYDFLGRRDKEILVLEESLDKFPKSSRLFNIVFDVYSNQLYNDSASLKTLNRAYNNGAVNFKIYEKLGFISAQRNDSKSAIKYWKEAISKYGDNFDLFFNIAVAFHRSQEFQEALNYYLKADQMKPDNKDLLVDLVFCCDALKDDNKTKTYYDRLMQLYSPDQLSEDIRNKLSYLIKNMRK